MSKSILTKDFICEHFLYKDGDLYWKLFSNKKGWHSKKAGFITNDGVYKVKISNRFYGIHRLIYMMFHGEMPSHISHKNKNKLDNRIENLEVSNFVSSKTKAKTSKFKEFESKRRSFVYRWDHVNGDFYIGKHMGNVDDGYICGNQKVKNLIKQNKSDWSRSILLTTNNETDAYKVETLLIRVNKNNKFCLNN
jgi:hypothetical protein